MVYGAKVELPKGITSGEKNALLVAINDHLEDATDYNYTVDYRQKY
jgi:hypothetical protein